MKKILVSCFVLTALSGQLLAQASPVPAPRETSFADTVSVAGSSRVTLVPDRVTFTIGVETMSVSVDDAVSLNNQKVASILAALKKGGAVDREIRTSNFSIYPQQRYEEGKPPRITGYQASNSITVTRSNPADAGKLLQAAISAGANNASGLSFLVSDDSKPRISGLQKAFEDARLKAQALASVSGRSLGRAMIISEGSVPFSPPRPMMAMESKVSAQSAEVSVQPGSEEVQFTVSVTFELR